MKKVTSTRGNEGDFMGTNLGSMGQSGRDFGINSSNGASLKGKLQTLEVY